MRRSCVSHAPVSLFALLVNPQHKPLSNADLLLKEPVDSKKREWVHSRDLHTVGTWIPTYHQPRQPSSNEDQHSLALPSSTSPSPVRAAGGTPGDCASSLLAPTHGTASTGDSDLEPRTPTQGGKHRHMEVPSSVLNMPSPFVANGSSLSEWSITHTHTHTHILDFGLWILEVCMFGRGWGVHPRCGQCAIFLWPVCNAPQRNSWWCPKGQAAAQHAREKSMFGVAFWLTMSFNAEHCAHRCWPLLRNLLLPNISCTIRCAHRNV